MQKGGGDADDGLNPPPQPSVEGAGVYTTSTPRPPDGGTTAHVLRPGTGGVSPIQASPTPPVVLGGAIQTVGTAPNVVCPQTGLPPQLRELISNSPAYRPINPHSLTPLSAQFLGTPGLGRRVYSPTSATVVTCPNMLSATLSPHNPTILTSHSLHRQLLDVAGVIGGRALPQQTGGAGYKVGNDPVLIASNTSISASGGTIHHHGQSPTRGGLPPLASPSQTIGGVSSSVGVTHAQRHREVTMTATTTPQTTTPPLSRNLFEGLTKSLAASAALGPSPRKKARIEEKPAATPEIAQQRKIILDSKFKDMGKIRTAYIENLTEFFFLQNGGNIMDYISWKKRPTPQLVHFLKSGNLDSDEEDDHQVTVKTYNDEVKVWTGAGSNVPLSTPVAISKTLPPNVSALTQGGASAGVNQGQSTPTHLKNLVSSASDSSGLMTPTMTVSVPSSLSVTTTSTPGGQPSVSVAKSITSPLTPPPNLHSQLAKCIASLNTSQFKSALTTSISNGNQKSRFPPSKIQKISSVCTGPLGSQEAIVERAKQEAQVMQRVSELRKDGMWSSRRLPKVQEPPRNKAHWDYLLEEMQWLAADFAQERKWKKAGARKIARMVAKYHSELHQKEVRAEKEEAMRLRKIASLLAKHMREFWTNIEKVVQYKQQSRLEEKRKKALDLHLNFIVDQTEKYSTWLTEGLAGSTAGSVTSEPTNDQATNSGDEDFQPAQEDSDDEETIDKEELEFGTDEASTQEEIAALQKESEVPIEELIKTIPQEVFSKPASLVDDEDQDVDIEGDGDSESGVKDEEFKGQEDEEDMEETIDEQEKHERGNKQKEMDELKAEGEMSLEELAEKYSGAYDSDFEFPDDSTDGETENEESEEESPEEELTEEEEEEEMEEETTTEDVGLEYLMNAENKNTQEELPLKKEPETEGPGKEITDIAAEALSLQPKGYTLQTTEVKTKIPFLLKHTLREYQHVGLNWLATMYEKRLNGILADEMGLGKTIQTIALLAHLVCEKGVWGPHLIVVPTSVMLNWEMEIKKWCPAFKILTYYGNQKERKQKRTGWTKTNAFHICITSYKLVIQDHQSFRRKKWKYFILDEAQNIKNFKSQRWQTLLNFSSQRRLLLTGTPLQNSLMELWSLMHFLMPHVFQSHKEFKEWFSNPLSGMIEGSHEYNDSLVRRLHKVLRPFLLRRLKDDVEKQMPKKYEHVIMCKLSKRQRYLYDDFMAQTKTRETLSSGHFMSVINILMQLRKVCNHPNLFDPRPIVSPFQMEGIVYHTPSIVLQALDYNPHQMVDLKTLYPSLVDMELDLASFVSRRVKKLQTDRQLIMEIDDQPDPPPRPKPAKKPIIFRSVSPMLQSGSGRSSPISAVSQSLVTPGRSASPITIVRTAANALRTQSPVPMKLAVTPTQLQPQRLTAPPVASAVVQPVTPTTVVLSSQPMATRLPSTFTGIHASKLPTLQGSILNSTGSIPSQPITVQIQQTEQGTQLMIPSGQLSQLPGFIQIVQTSTGQQLITTSSPLTSVQSAMSGTHLIQAVSSSPLIQTTPTTPVLTTNAGPQIIQAATVTPVQSSVIPSPTVQTASITPVQSTLSNTPIVHLASNAVQSSSTMPIIPASSVTPVQSVLSSLPVAPITASTTQPIVLSTRPSLASVQSMLHQSMPGVSTAQSLVNGVPVSNVNVSTSSTLNASPVISTPLMVTPTVAPVRLTGTILQASSSPTQGVISTSKPVMRVSPLSVDSSKLKLSTGTTATTHVTSKPTASIASVPRVVTAAPVRAVRPPKPKSEFHWAALESRLLKKRQEKLELLCKLNKRHCDVDLLYGQDVCNRVDLHQTIDCNKPVCDDWTGAGYLHCYNTQHCKHPHRTGQYLNQTETLSKIVHTPDQYLTELKDILQRYVFVIPVAVAPCIQLQAAHPSPSYLVSERRKKVELHQELSPRMDCLHTITANMTVTFPELRLIQYDCGKLQTLDILLRDLKSGDHRVLIFTQMTKMLDVLECFLNYHGHRYLRLDGTTKVEQRQALMDRFNADRRIFVFILSTRSGGLGVNLTGADTVIFYDSDWNPTMDAQAQDRCHRIGQTRDVHIYRLISQKTIEENILKKANQKRLLGDLAIEGGNFTTAFFKEQTLKDLFDEPSGLDQLAREKAATQERKEAKAAALASIQLPGTEVETTKTIVAKFEEALCIAEDESDVLAANQVRAEQKAELAEFDENIPWDEKDEKKPDNEVSKLEQELAMLEKELSPVERYAVIYIESQMEPYNAEELEIAEEEVELAKNSWELNRLKSLKEEEERRAEWEEDEMLFTYSRDRSHNQVKKNSKSRRSQSKAGSAASTPRTSRASSRRSTEASQDTPVKSTPVKTEKVNFNITPTPVKVNHVESTPRLKSPVSAPAPKVTSPKATHTVLKIPTPIRSPKPQVASPPPNLKFTSPTVSNPRAKVLSPKENSNPNTPLPWSNPNLVIRTRRASKQEAVIKKEDRMRNDSENSEVDILTVQSDTSVINIEKTSSGCNSPILITPIPSKSLQDTIIQEKCKQIEKINHRNSQDSNNGMNNHVNDVDQNT